MDWIVKLPKHILLTNFTVPDDDDDDMVFVICVWHRYDRYTVRGAHYIESTFITSIEQ